MYKFLRNAIFANDQSLWFYFQGSLILLSALVIHMDCMCFKDLIFVDDKLPVKTAKLYTSLVRIRYVLLNKSPFTK